VIDSLEAGEGSVRFDDIVGHDLGEAQLRHNVVVSLLAILELARLKVIRVLQDLASGAFLITRVEGAALEQARVMRPTSVVESAPREGSGEPDGQT
jgi:chromatin segregation and condensation protein Rec8/ScpA/Scc1 (kleisin family)